MRYDPSRIVLLPEAEAELAALPLREEQALANGIEKLAVMHDRLGFPHTSAVRGAPGLRELRPRRGKSRWRAFYGYVAGLPVVGAVGPEAEVDRLGFMRAVRVAEERIDEYRRRCEAGS